MATTRDDDYYMPPSDRATICGTPSGDESAVSSRTSTVIETALKTITQSHEILYQSCDLLGWVVLMGMVLLEFCLPF